MRQSIDFSAEVPAISSLEVHIQYLNCPCWQQDQYNCIHLSHSTSLPNKHARVSSGQSFSQICSLLGDRRPVLKTDESPLSPYCDWGANDNRFSVIGLKQATSASQSGPRRRQLNPKTFKTNKYSAIDTNLRFISRTLVSMSL
jgi:hypothetical protein